MIMTTKEIHTQKRQKTTWRNVIWLTFFDL